ncbi:MAG TPA: TetR/AcrR family transcriptional regulator C-terminal domain-containing protein [Polyangiaceae bacterium]|jgi:DNA-binding transcriptional regulator YhcF (GntR family)
MSPYLRIVEDVRARIASGELRVGDRLPSTRELAATWKVANATAAHALRALVERGYARSVSRVGTLVARPRTRATPEVEGGERERDLTRSRIVGAAIAIADAEGLGAVSLRAVAVSVGAPVMSLYRHVRGKDQLLAWMTDAALGEEKLPDAAALGWRPRLELGARAEWRVFRRHPWLARLVHLTRPQPLPNALAYADFVLGALDATGADAQTKLRLHVIMHAFVQGMAVNVEAEVDAQGETGVDEEEWMRRQSEGFQSLAASGRYPAFARTLADVGDFDLDLDEIFERGLSALLDGFARLLERR